MLGWSKQTQNDVEQSKTKQLCISKGKERQEKGREESAWLGEWHHGLADETEAKRRPDGASHRLPQVRGPWEGLASRNWNSWADGEQKLGNRMWQMTAGKRNRNTWCRRSVKLKGRDSFVFLFVGDDDKQLQD